MKKKAIIAIITAFIFIIFGAGAVIFTIGRTANIQTNIQLEETSSDIEHALYYASFAANSHNTQSWKINLYPKQNRLEIFLNHDRSLNVVDPNNRELYISIGCYIQSLKTAFEVYGYNVNVSNVTPSKENKYQVVLINYQKLKTSKINNKQLKIIQKRHTDKRKFQKKSINRKAISSLTKKYDNVYYYAKGSKIFKYLQKGTLAAATEQYKSQDFLKEQGKWLRFSNQEAEKKQDGISGDMLGLNPIVKALYYLTSNHKNATSNNFVKQSKNTLTNQVENCAGFFVITGEQSISKWISVGEKSQAFWYDCVRHNIAVQPISAMIEIPSYNQKLQQNLGKSQPAQLILRVGYVKNYGKNVAVRRNLKDYITVIK